MASTAPEAPTAPFVRPLPQSVDGGLASIWRDFAGLLSDRVELLSLEVQRAGQALAKVLMLMAACAAFAATAWLLLWGCIVVVLARAGVDMPILLLGTVIFNLLAAWLAWSRMRAAMPRVSLPATRRHLTITPSIQPSTAGPTAGP